MRSRFELSLPGSVPAEVSASTKDARGRKIMRMCARLALAAAMVLIALNCAFAQDPQYGYGVLSGHTYVGDHEQINVCTGNLHLEVPLLKLPGRNGHDYTLALSYNSQLWSGAVQVVPKSGGLQAGN